MPGRRKQKRFYPPPIKKPSSLFKPNRPILLEDGSLEDIQKRKDLAELHLKYQWDYYSELAHQRNQIQEELKKALIQSSVSKFQFKKWQRAVKWKYSLHPLSTAGSLSYVGQRFNTGKDVNSAVPSFPALYIAFDKDTALQETLGQADVKGSGLSSKELALSNPQSEVIISVSGELEKVIDLRTPKSLDTFFDLIKNFSLTSELTKRAKLLNINAPTTVNASTQQLLKTLLIPDWKTFPVGADVPANSQIFGNLVYSAGIEGILYPSKLTKKNCLAIFPHNFNESSSYISLDDEAPHKDVPKKVDRNNWRICDLTQEEVINLAALKGDIIS